LKRSNRLVLLIGILLAAVVFVLVAYLLTNNTGPRPGETPEVPTELPTVYATRNIPLGARISAEMVEARVTAVTLRATNAIAEPTLILGEIVRKPIAEGAQVTSEDFAVDTSPNTTDVVVPPGLRAMAVQVDQITGVGTLIRSGDYVDMVVALTGEQFPVITINPEDQSITVVSGLNSTSVRLLLQGVQVIGSLLPPPPAAQGNQPPDPGTALTGQQEIVILAVNPQQAEVLKYAQTGSSITLLLRAPEDFFDPDTNEPIVPEPAVTTGIILKSLIDEYGVLVPELIEAILPEVAATPPPG
jgi:pilus assembly protein CpaB